MKYKEKLFVMSLWCSCWKPTLVRYLEMVKQFGPSAIVYVGTLHMSRTLISFIYVSRILKHKQCLDKILDFCFTP